MSTNTNPPPARGKGKGKATSPPLIGPSSLRSAVAPPSRESETAGPGNQVTEHPISQSETETSQHNLEEQISSQLGMPIQLTDKQFRLLLAQMTPRDSGQDSRQASVPPSSLGDPIEPVMNDLDDNLPEQQPIRSDRLRHQTSQVSDQDYKRSAKVNDPTEFNDGQTIDYESWSILMKDKLRANADWWEDEQARITYVFSRTTGTAAKHLKPRMDFSRPHHWTSVTEIWEYLNLQFKDPYEQSEAQRYFVERTQGPMENFYDFYADLAEAAAIGQVDTSTLRTALLLKLNHTFSKELMATEHQYPTYASLVGACRRLQLNMDMVRRRFPRSVPPSKPAKKPALPAKTYAALPAASLPTPAATSLPAPAETSRRLSPFVPRREPTPGRPSPALSDGCYRCGKTGHFRKDCPAPRQRTPGINKICPKDRFEELESGDEAEAENEEELSEDNSGNEQP